MPAGCTAAAAVWTVPRTQATVPRMRSFLRRLVIVTPQWRKSVDRKSGGSLVFASAMKVLSIDGGGIRGLIPALVLAEIERRTGRRTAEMFDLIAGTSTGGILACALARRGEDGRPMYSAEELSQLYITEGPKIFDQSLLKKFTSVGGLIDEKYDDKGLNTALAAYLGDARLKDVLADVMLTAYDIHDRFAFFFRSVTRAHGRRVRLLPRRGGPRDSAAPTYFEPIEVTDAAGARTYPLIDGGIYAINPAMCAYAEVAAEGHELEVLASLGTGSHTKPYEFADVKGWGKLEWAQPLIDMVFDGIADTVDFEAATLGGRPLQALPGRAALRLRRARRRQRIQPPPPRRRRRAPDRRAHGRDRGALRGHRELRNTLGHTRCPSATSSSTRS